MSYTPGSGAVISFVVDGAQAAKGQIEAIGGSFGQLSGHAKSSVKELAAFAGIGLSIGALAEHVMNAQREFDKTNASLITATGSAANAGQAFKALQAFAATTPYSLAESTEAFIKMRNLGLDPSEKALRSYGNTAAAMGKGLDQMVEAVADATTGEFERLKEFGIKAKKNGDDVSFTFQGVTKTIGNNAKEIEGYLQSIGEQNFGGAMELRAATLDGAVSNLGDAWESTMRTISQNGVGSAMASSVTAISSSLTDLNAILDAVAGSAKKEGEAMKEASALHVALTTVFETVAVLGVNVAYVMEQAGLELGGLAAQAAAVAHGDFELARGIGKTMREEAEEARKAVDAKTEAILGASAKAKKAAAEEAAAKKESGRDDLAQFKTVLSAAEQAAEAVRKHTEAMKKYATTPEQLAEELKKLKTELGSSFTAADEARVRKHFAGMDEGAKKVAAAAEKEKEAYSGLVTSIGEKIDQNKLELATGEGLTESQKMQVKLDQELTTGKLKLSQSHLTAVRAMLAELSATEDLVKAQQGEKAGLTWMQQSAQARNASSAALAAEYEQYGKSTDTREIAMLAVKAEADLEKFLSDERRKGVDIGEEVEAQLRAEKDMRVEVEQATLAQSKALGYATQLATENKRTAAESISDPRAREQALLNIEADTWRERVRLAGEGTEAQKKLQAEFDIWYASRLKGASTNVDLTQAHAVLDIMSALDESAQAAAQSMAASFGRVGTAIGSLTTALSGYGRTQAAIAAQLAAATKDAGGDQTKILRANTVAAQQSAQAQIKSYGDMAGAAKGFFHENSTGYRVLEGVEKAYRATEMAMAMESMFAKLTSNATVTSAVIEGHEAQTTAAAGAAGAQVAANTTVGMSAAAVGVANQAKGDPYTAWARMAAMAALMAGLGFAVSGGGGGKSLAAQRQEQNGTGTVLGDPTAKSESIAKSLDILADNSGIELSHTAGMLDALRSIDSNIAGLGNLLVRSGSLSGNLAPQVNGRAADFGNSAMGVHITGGLWGTVLDKISGGRLGKATGKVLGAIFGGKVSAIDTGLTANRASLGSVLTDGLSANQYTETKKSGGWFHSDKYSTTTTSLGAEANDQFTKVITGLAGGIQEAGKLLGISGDAFTNRLNSFVVDVGLISLKDLSAEAIQKQLEAVFSKMGDDMARFGVGGLDQFQEVGEGYLQTLARVASNYANLDSIMSSIGATFGAVGIESLAARERFLKLTGGVKELNDKTSAFADNFLSEAERLAPVQKWVAEQMAAMGLANVTTMEQYKQTVLNLANSGALATEAGAKQYAGLLNLADAFAKTHEQTKVLVRDAKEIADERKNLQSQLDELTLSSSQLLARQRDAIDASNRSLYDQVEAAKAVRKAQDEAKSSLSNFMGQMESFATTAAGLNSSLVLGELSTLTPEQQYAEARRQFEQTRQLAAAGNADAQGKLSAAEHTFLQLSQKLNGGDSQYSSDLATVMRTNDELAHWAVNSVDVAKASLDALNDSSATLADISATLTAIAQGAQRLPAGSAGAEVQTYAQPVPGICYSNIGTSNMIALVDEIKALRASNEAMAAELRGLRADQQRQTGDMIAAGAGAAQHAAETVVEGVRHAVGDAAYIEANSARALS